MHLGAQELIVILLIVLILFGGKKVSGLGKALGTSLREFKEEVNKADDAAAEVSDAVKNTMPTEEKSAVSDANKEAKADTK